MAFFEGNSVVENIDFASASTVTISGVAQNGSGAPIERKVYAYHARDLTRSVAETISSASTGDFSLSLPGIASTEFAVLVVGEPGENCSVHTHKTGI